MGEDGLGAILFSPLARVEIVFLEGVRSPGAALGDVSVVWPGI